MKQTLFAIFKKCASHTFKRVSTYPNKINKKMGTMTFAENNKSLSIYISLYSIAVKCKNFFRTQNFAIIHPHTRKKQEEMPCNHKIFKLKKMINIIHFFVHLKQKERRLFTFFIFTILSPSSPTSTPCSFAWILAKIDTFSHFESNSSACGLHSH